MSEDAFLTFFRRSLPADLAAALEDQLAALETGDFEAAISGSPVVQTILGHRDDTDGERRRRRTSAVPPLDDHPVWTDWIHRRLTAILDDGDEPDEQEQRKRSGTAAAAAAAAFAAAVAALLAFVQSNVTGPPLPFSPARLLLPAPVAADPARVRELRRELAAGLGADGAAAYALAPDVELLCFAEGVARCGGVADALERAGAGAGGGLTTALRWARVRIAFLRQRLLVSDPAPSLQAEIYAGLEAVESGLAAGAGEGVRVPFLLERAAVHTLHGFDAKARADLERAAGERGFEFALTGLMGKRTRFQERDTSQLVVLARSKGAEGAEEDGTSGKGKGKVVEEEGEEEEKEHGEPEKKPRNLDLNDDTLLESISFSEKPKSSTDILEESALPPSLAALDPGNQPKLEPLDSIILLSLASSITNTSPQNGLTREETLPYATRVLEGGSSNWQVYTQALLVRSRIEGYRARTAERGLLQLQALVDQVIADTAGEGSTAAASGEGSASTFLPRPSEEDSAPASERLRYVFQLCSPTRWELESELAQTWVKMGGLRSALEIYERLQMWAEVALCYAATDREDKARRIVRKQLFHATDGNDNAAAEDEKWEGAPRDPAPAEAPRLYCILGDIDKDPAMYEKAWEVSGNRYARAQRSLGRFYYSEKDFLKSANAYSKSLRVNQLNQQSWFAMGCALLELAQYERAVEAFTRVVQLDDNDAEAWSNLAAALLRLEPKEDAAAQQDPTSKLDDEEDDDPDHINLTKPRRDPQQHRRDALKALKRAAHLQFDNYRIWDNLLTVAASLTPPSHADIITAQRRVIDLRGATDGEACVDAGVLDALARDMIALEEGGYDPDKPGPARMMVRLVDEKVVPLITGSRDLWNVVARLALWRRRPQMALDAHEKAWRAVVSRPGWETASEERVWDEVVEATVELADAYESLGPMERTEGLSAGSGQAVMKDWKFKARSAVKGICSRGRETWEGTKGWERLRERLEELKGN